MERPDFFTLKNGDKAKLPFTEKEYQRRLDNLRNVMNNNNLDMIILTSMHNIAYYTGFIYCSFGRPYGCIVTKNKIKHDFLINESRYSLKKIGFTSKPLSKKEMIGNHFR